jgi:hypothetical protein
MSKKADETRARRAPLTPQQVAAELQESAAGIPCTVEVEAGAKGYHLILGDLTEAQARKAIQALHQYGSVILG